MLLRPRGAVFGFFFSRCFYVWVTAFFARGGERERGIDRKMSGNVLRVWFRRGAHTIACTQSTRCGDDDDDDRRRQYSSLRRKADRVGPAEAGRMRLDVAPSLVRARDLLNSPITSVSSRHMLPFPPIHMTPPGSPTQWSTMPTCHVPQRNKTECCP
ncbi:hypothetical protein BXZ70DRAFT_370459 [Cristinia sonorae]|uniref:Uncharacterized protein n=1 Tax=Cristinia sonorae TaxID=1940300 RepID=A0A8K0UKA9_9AGAR|nr:hypothetical protein BXZ70DRAFT_370459 [Cristinia sonorae]